MDQRLPIKRRAHIAKAPIKEHAARNSSLPDNPYATFDRSLHAALARLTGGISPAAIASAYLDWGMHVLAAPGRQLELMNKALSGALASVDFATRCALSHRGDPCDCALPHDNRFRAPDWCAFPYNVYASTFLATERWWEAATSNVRGVSKRHEDVVTFITRQLLDTVAPSNFVLTNPQVLARTREEKGRNLVRGWNNWLDDVSRIARSLPPAGTEAYQVGKSVAATPGKVICRTRLAEIIQYAPTRQQVRPEPIVIV
ncbi:MAG: poly-beta-hydroxybutyrate polymerase N-terminal domain-containing protein, partial [Bradyrhizobiaceae bacterium]|nr:poly-beta-hydroxybutyrate polymerase N-terminal domain-containing protein [Bradyrhizobiaceae bacterium]